MIKEELLDRLAIEVLKASPQSARDAYRVAEDMIERRQEIISKWALREAIVDDGIENLNLTIRSANCLRAENIHTVLQLLTYRENDLLKLPNFGRKSLKEIIEQLDARGLKLRGQP
jgi:DNA-directed RNA polymerase subunit alpha